MAESLKDAVRRRAVATLPPQSINRVRTVRAGVATRQARRAFEACTGGPSWLAPEMLPVLERRYPASPAYDWDPDTLDARGDERADRVLGLSDRSTGQRILEIGASDGMVSAKLAEAGASAVANDLTTERFDPRVATAGVEVVGADASSIPYDDASFDVAFSYNAFEHFDDPPAVLREAIRLVRPDGVLYFRFGPLYAADYGAHYQHALGVPFAQHLFEPEVLSARIDAAGRGPSPYVNRWTLAQFRALWPAFEAQATRELYLEIPSVNGFDLVAEHPSCFVGKVDGFDDLVISVIEIVLRRTSAPLG